MAGQEFLVLGDDFASAGASAQHHSDGFAVGPELRRCITENCELAERPSYGIDCGRHNDDCGSLFMFSVGDSAGDRSSTRLFYARTAEGVNDHD